MSGIKDQERIEELRQRLYQRGKPLETRAKHALEDRKIDIGRGWEKPPEALTEPVPAPVSPESEPAEPPVFTNQESIAMAPKKKRHYRVKLVLAAVAFFVIAVAVSSMFLAVGKNTISGENITLAVSGPFTIGGGEVLPLQVGISNDNAVAIESATLIVEYPLGTQSVGEEGKELFAERLALDSIRAGETINVPLRAVVFGEENDEKIVNISVEYRVQGSNATFFKEADPLRFKISSSPIIVRADALKKVSSGQETKIKLTITSNAPTTLSEVLVKAEYPLGFDFTSAEPSPTGAQNMWLIKNLEPEATKEIIITGIVVGKETDEYAINFTVGVPNERDKQSLASVFATASTEFQIEQPFLDIKLAIGNDSSGNIVVAPGQQTSATVEIQNTLEDTLYDIIVEVKLSGNALSDLDVGPPRGFYDSTKNKIIWDVSTSPELQQLTPGSKVRLTFALEPSSDVSRTPQIDINVDVRARRVSESQVAEELIGKAETTIKVASIPQVIAETGHNNGIFVDSGPVPPVAEQLTKYTMSLMVENGSNEIADTEVSAVLPTYVTYIDQVAGSGDVAYNPSSRTVTWKVGNVSANAASFTSFQVSIIPSVTQIDTTPTLMGEQRLKATDLFTGSVVRDTNPAVTTEMSTESGFPKGNGRVTQ